VPQDIGDLFEWPSLQKQPACDAVAEDVDPCPGPAASAICRPNGPLHGACPDRLIVGRDVANENGPVRRRRSLRAQVVGDRASCLNRQREQVGAARLTLGDAQRASPPV
jgi:hypothetical protein